MPVGRVILFTDTVPPCRVDQEAVRQHVVEHRDAGVHNAARVIAKVNDQTLHALLLELIDRLLELIRRHGVKLEHADVADFIRLHLRLDRRHHNVAARYVKCEFFVLVAAEHLDFDAGSLCAANIARDQDIQIFSGHILSGDLVENVVGLKSRLFGRGSRKHGHNAADFRIRILIQHGADSGILPAGLFGQLLVLIRRVVDRVGIAETRHHALIDAVLDIRLLLVKEIVLVYHILQEAHLRLNLIVIQIFRIGARLCRGGLRCLVRPVRPAIASHPEKQNRGRNRKHCHAGKKADEKALPVALLPHVIIARMSHGRLRLFPGAGFLFVVLPLRIFCHQIPLPWNSYT